MQNVLKFYMLPIGQIKYFLAFNIKGIKTLHIPKRILSLAFIFSIGAAKSTIGFSMVKMDVFAQRHALSLNFLSFNLASVAFGLFQEDSKYLGLQLTGV